MNNLNQVLIEGNLVADPIERKTPEGITNCEFRLASSRYVDQGEGDYQTEVSFYKIEAHSQLADKCLKDLKQGRGVRVIGRLANDGAKSKVIIRAEHIVTHSKIDK